jgi:hypothetical protein
MMDGGSAQGKVATAKHQRFIVHRTWAFVPHEFHAITIICAVELGLAGLVPPRSLQTPSWSLSFDQACDQVTIARGLGTSLGGCLWWFAMLCTRSGGPFLTPSQEGNRGTNPSVVCASDSYRNL